MVAHRPLASYRTPAAWIVAVGVCALALGCAGYQVGHQTLFQPHIRTVYVPVFASDIYRRQLGEWLTEAVIREIELRTPYKVVHTPDADSVLYGRIISEHKSVLAEDRNDNPRNLAFDMVVEVRWVDRGGTAIMRTATVPVDLTLLGSSHFVPEGGQSLATAEQAVVRQIARQIVGQMEAGW
jgi:hypothetical protein